MSDEHTLLLKSKDKAQEQQKQEDPTNNEKSTTLKYLAYHNDSHHRYS